MKDDIAGVGSGSTGPTWEVLEGWVRERAQALIQGILEEEVTELLGRRKSERKRAVDAAAGYRNGYGDPLGSLRRTRQAMLQDRRLYLFAHSVRVRSPRSRKLVDQPLRPIKLEVATDLVELLPAVTHDLACPAHVAELLGQL